MNNGKNGMFNYSLMVLVIRIKIFWNYNLFLKIRNLQLIFFDLVRLKELHFLTRVFANILIFLLINQMFQDLINGLLYYFNILIIYYLSIAWKVNIFLGIIK